MSWPLARPVASGDQLANPRPQAAYWRNLPLNRHPKWSAK